MKFLSNCTKEREIAIRMICASLVRWQVVSMAVVSKIIPVSARTVARWRDNSNIQSLDDYIVYCSALEAELQYVKAERDELREVVLINERERCRKIKALQ